MWTKSACVVLAWSVMLILVAVGSKGYVRATQANIRIASSTQVTLSSTLSVAVTPRTATAPAARYVVQPGDTLSAIAAALDVRGGWPALYAANRGAIGPDPNVIRPGTVLALPGRMAPVRVAVAAGDTLSGIAAALALPGGWPALYAANRRVIGPDPNTIRAGTVLTVPRAAGPPPRASGPGRSQHRTPPRAAGGKPHHRVVQPMRAPVATGMPEWLKIMLLVVALLIGTALIGAAFLRGPVLAIARRRRQAGAQGPQPLPAQKARIVMADYRQLIVTHSRADNTVYVLRPPGEDPKAILRVARLVVAEDPYRDLAEYLGLPASWPIVMADYDRLVVTCSRADDTAYVLRPPGEDPKAVLRAARLVLPEDHYEELASQLGVAANWPLE
jgi:LysM repeat protein